MMDEKCGYKTPTPADSLEQQIIDPSFPKTEREWWASDEITRLRAEVEALRADAERLTGERDVAIGMLAYWCVAVDQNGTGWDDWDEHYKDAMYRPCPFVNC